MGKILLEDERDEATVGAQCPRFASLVVPVDFPVHHVEMERMIWVRKRSGWKMMG